jgi:hypothetical protein
VRTNAKTNARSRSAPRPLILHAGEEAGVKSDWHG